MTPNFAHKLLNAEIAPPESVWEKIATGLDKSEGSGFVTKVAEASVEPPASVWQRVADAISTPQLARRTPIGRNWVKWAAAAVVVGLIVVIGFNLFKPDIPQSVTSADQAQPKNETNVTPSAGNNTNDASSGGATSPLDPNKTLADNNGSLIPRRGSSRDRTPTKNPVRHASIESVEIEKQDVLSSEGEPRVSNNVSSTPANIIPAPEYFVVTAPNGEKVRISSKFSDAVASLYGGDNVDYYWKWRFDSWKSKLMTNPSFIPSAGNFLDIVELKDMLKEQ